MILAAEELGDRYVRLEACVGQVEVVLRRAFAVVGQNRDDLGVVVAFAEGDGALLAVDGVVAEGGVVEGSLNGVVADDVEGLDVQVKRVGGVVAVVPEGFAVQVALCVSGLVLFLALVDDGDAVAEDGVGEDILGQSKVVRVAREACNVVVLLMLVGNVSI